MTRIKICGLTRPEDVDLACALGASYVGFVFASGSPRRVGLERAAELSRAVRPGVARVGVFVQEGYGFMQAAVETAHLDLAQIHRPLREEDLHEISVPVVAVARVTGEDADLPPRDLLARCQSVLFDTAADERSGGAGRPFDWSLLAGRSFSVPVFLAGGLHSDNVGEAIGRVRPFAVDVASGVESEPGRKDEGKMRRFFDAVADADARPGRDRKQKAGD